MMDRLKQTLLNRLTSGDPIKKSLFGVKGLLRKWKRIVSSARSFEEKNLPRFFIRMSPLSYSRIFTPMLQSTFSSSQEAYSESQRSHRTGQPSHFRHDTEGQNDRDRVSRSLSQAINCFLMSNGEAGRSFFTFICIFLEAGKNGSGTIVSPGSLIQTICVKNEKEKGEARD